MTSQSVEELQRRMIEAREQKREAVLRFREAEAEWETAVIAETTKSLEARGIVPGTKVRFTNWRGRKAVGGFSHVEVSYGSVGARITALKKDESVGKRITADCADPAELSLADQP